MCLGHHTIWQVVIICGNVRCLHSGAPKLCCRWVSLNSLLEGVAPLLGTLVVCWNALFLCLCAKAMQ